MDIPSNPYVLLGLVAFGGFIFDQYSIVMLCLMAAGAMFYFSNR